MDPLIRQKSNFLNYSEPQIICCFATQFAKNEQHINVSQICFREHLEPCTIVIMTTSQKTRGNHALQAYAIYTLQLQNWVFQSYQTSPIAHRERNSPHTYQIFQRNNIFHWKLLYANRWAFDSWLRHFFCSVVQTIHYFSNTYDHCYFFKHTFQEVPSCRNLFSCITFLATFSEIRQTLWLSINSQNTQEWFKPVVILEWAVPGRLLVF